MVTQQAETHAGVGELFVQWLVLNMVGWLTGLWVLLTIGWSLGWWLSQRSSLNLGDVLASVVGFAAGAVVAGALIGLVQAVVLRERGVNPRAWVVATIGGLVAGVAIALPAALPLESPNNIAALVVIALIFGLTLAVSQWLVLRARLPQAVWWVPAATLGLALCFLSAFLLGGEGREVLAVSVGALANALVTGLAVVALFRR